MRFVPTQGIFPIRSNTIKAKKVLRERDRRIKKAGSICVHSGTVEKTTVDSLQALRLKNDESYAVQTSPGEWMGSLRKPRSPAKQLNC